MTSVDMVDLGLFGLGEKGSELDQDLYDHNAELENLFPMNNVQSILDISMEHAGIVEETVEQEDSMLVSTPIRQTCSLVWVQHVINYAWMQYWSPQHCNWSITIGQRTNRVRERAFT